MQQENYHCIDETHHYIVSHCHCNRAANRNFLRIAHLYRKQWDKGEVLRTPEFCSQL